MQNQENKREKRKLTLPQLKLIVGSAALVVLTVLRTLASWPPRRPTSPLWRISMPAGSCSA